MNTLSNYNYKFKEYFKFEGSQGQSSIIKKKITDHSSFD